MDGACQGGVSTVTERAWVTKGIITMVHEFNMITAIGKKLFMNLLVWDWRALYHLPEGETVIGVSTVLGNVTRPLQASFVLDSLVGGVRKQ